MSRSSRVYIFILQLHLISRGRDRVVMGCLLGCIHTTRVRKEKGVRRKGSMESRGSGEEVVKAECRRKEAGIE